MDVRVASFVNVALAALAATAHAQARPRPAPLEPFALAVPRLAVPLALRATFTAEPPWLDGAGLFRVPAEVALALPAREVPLDISEHGLGEPMMPAVSQNNFLAELYRVRPVDGWTWVNLGVGTAGLGIAAAFLRAAGAEGTGIQLLQPRGLAAETGPMGDPLLVFGSYSLRYDNLGSVTLQAGLGAVSSSLFRLLYAPRDARTERYMRTFVTEYQGGWLFGFQGVLH
jgi:hypothetical protein